MRYLTVETGTCVPDKDGMGTCGMLEIPVEGGRRDAARILVDAGTGTLAGLIRAGIDPLALDGVFLTHHHPDHVGELPALLQSLSYGAATPRTDDFTVVGGPSTNELFACWERFFGGWVKGRSFEVAVRELSDGDMIELEDMPILSEAGSLAGATLKAARPNHTESSLAYRVEAGGRTVVLTGDTGPCDSLSDLAAGCDLLVVECSFPDDQAVAGHMYPSAVADLARKARVGKVLLHHFYPSCDPQRAIRSITKVASPSIPAIVARPGEWIVI
jgi:ribonuclease BN (tRNA processing enzyme)